MYVPDTRAAAEFTDVLRAFLRARREAPEVQAAALCYEMAAIIALHAPNMAAAIELIEWWTTNMKDQIATLGVGVEHP